MKKQFIRRACCGERLSCSFAFSWFYFVSIVKPSRSNYQVKKPVFRNFLRFVYVFVSFAFFTSLFRVSRTLSRFNLFSVEFKVAAAL